MTTTPTMCSGVRPALALPLNPSGVEGCSGSLATRLACMVFCFYAPLPTITCRPRERVHRPQTRRRRENNEDSLDKLRMVRENVLKALDLFEMLVKRERKKRDLLVR